MASLARDKLFVLGSRYKFQSNSQPVISGANNSANCLFWAQDTNFKAIHNNVRLQGYTSQLFVLGSRYKFQSNSQRCRTFLTSPCIVCFGLKIQISKQFTTTWSEFCLLLSLFVLGSRYKFQSNSQLPLTILPKSPYCLFWAQDTNFKAIHNNIPATTANAAIVCFGLKIQISKQFTTDTRCVCVGSWIVCFGLKIQISKQFTTEIACDELPIRLFVLGSRYKFQSNSQPSRMRIYTQIHCLFWAQDTNFKAIHNHTYLYP